MNGDRALVLFALVGCIALIGWKVADAYAPAVITPPTEPKDTEPEAVDTKAVINLTNGWARPMRTVYGPYMMLPPLIPWVQDREAPPDGC